MKLHAVYPPFCLCMSKFIFMLGSLKVIRVFIPIKIKDILTVFMIYVLPNLSRNFFEIFITLSDIYICIFKHKTKQRICLLGEAGLRTTPDIGVV